MGGKRDLRVECRTQHTPLKGDAVGETWRCRIVSVNLMLARRSSCSNVVTMIFILGAPNFSNTRTMNGFLKRGIAINSALAEAASPATRAPRTLAHCHNSAAKRLDAAGRSPA